MALTSVSSCRFSSITHRAEKMIQPCSCSLVLSITAEQLICLEINASDLHRASTKAFQ